MNSVIDSVGESMLNAQPLKNENWAFWEQFINAFLSIVKIPIYYVLNQRRLYITLD